MFDILTLIFFACQYASSLVLFVDHCFANSPRATGGAASLFVAILSSSTGVTACDDDLRRPWMNFDVGRWLSFIFADGGWLRYCFHHQTTLRIFLMMIASLRYFDEFARLQRRFEFSRCRLDEVVDSRYLTMRSEICFEIQTCVT